MARRKTKHTGVYERLSTVDKFQGRPDVAYDVAYKANGKLLWKCVGWKSEGMTAAEAADIRRDLIKTSRQKVNAALTFSDAWEIYKRDWLDAQGKACAATDLGMYVNHLRRRIGSKLLTEIEPADINAILREMRELSEQTQKHALGLVRRIYRKLMAWKMYKGDVPTDGLMPKKIRNDRLRFLTHEEARMLLAEMDCRSPDFADVCRVSLYAGLRLGEIFALQVQHVHLDTGLIDVMDAKAGTRQAFISDALKKALLRRVEGRKPQEYVFVQADGKSPMKYLSHVFVRVVRDLEMNAGVEDDRHKVVFHTLRHTFASWLVQSGVPLYTVADLMGHSDISMTKRYAKLADDDRRDAVAKIII